MNIKTLLTLALSISANYLVAADKNTIRVFNYKGYGYTVKQVQYLPRDAETESSTWRVVTVPPIDGQADTTNFSVAYRNLCMLAAELNNITYD